MKLVEFTGSKGAALWVSSAQITHVNQPETADGGGSLYGSSNGNSGARIWLAGGTYIDVRQTPDEVVARLSD